MNGTNKKKIGNEENRQMAQFQFSIIFYNITTKKVSNFQNDFTAIECDKFSFQSS